MVLAIAGTLIEADDPAAAQTRAPARIWLENVDCAAPYGFEFDAPELSVTVHGHNFSPNSRIQIWSWESNSGFDDVASPETTVDADGYGTFDAQIFVFQPFAAGDYRIEAIDVDSDGTIRAETLFYVPCQGTITLDPPCADPPLGSDKLSINVTGQGWGNESIVLVQFVRYGGGVLDQVRAPVTDGFFQVTLQPPNASFAVIPLTAGVYGVLLSSGRAIVGYSAFHVPCADPQIVVDPDCGPPGQPPDRHNQIAISGSGFEPVLGGPATGLLVDPRPIGVLEIMVDVNGRREQFDHAGGVGDDGRFGPLFIDPYLRPSGTFDIRVRQYFRNAADTERLLVHERTVTFVVPCPPPGEPRVEIEDDCGPPAWENDIERRYAIIVRGFDFAPGPVTITFDPIPVSAAGPELFPAEAGSDGRFTQIINPLARPVNAAGYELHIVQDVVFPAIVLTDTRFFVPCQPLRTPLLTLRCDPAEPEQPELAELVIEGTAFYEQAPVLVTVGVGEPQPTVTDAAGTFVQRVPLAGTPPGPLGVSAVQRDALLTVVVQAQAVIVLPCGTPPEPLLRLLSQSAAPGAVVVAEGIFFPAGEPIALRWDRGLTRGQASLATPDATGLFRVQLLILHHDFLGERELTAHRASDESVTYAEPVSLLVVHGRGTPPAFKPPLNLAFEQDTLIVIRR